MKRKNGKRDTERGCSEKKIMKLKKMKSECSEIYFRDILYIVFWIII